MYCSGSDVLRTTEQKTSKKLQSTDVCSRLVGHQEGWSSVEHVGSLTEDAGLLKFIHPYTTQTQRTSAS